MLSNRKIQEEIIDRNLELRILLDCFITDSLISFWNQNDKEKIGYVT